jgi:acyl carrier protein
MSTTITTEAVHETVFKALVEIGADEAQVTREAEFTALDVDSLDLAELSQIVEEEYGVTLKGADVSELKTVGDAVDLIVARAGS